jgi:hypothetical protein
MNPWIVVPMLVVLAVLFVLLPVAAAVFTQFRRRKLVRCPDTQRDAVIRVDAMQAAVAELLHGGRFTVVECSLGSRQLSCGQACVRTTPWVMRDAPRAT